MAPHIRTARVTVVRLLRQVPHRARLELLRVEVRRHDVQRGVRPEYVEEYLAGTRCFAEESEGQSELAMLRNHLVINLANESMDRLTTAAAR